MMTRSTVFGIGFAAHGTANVAQFRDATLSRSAGDDTGVDTAEVASADAVETTPAPTRASSFAEGTSPVHGTRRLLLLSSIVVTFLASSSAPTPLYQRYDHLWHGTALTTTVAFGIYALGVLTGLLSLGELSSHIGRKPVLLAALFGQAVAVVLFSTATSFTPPLVGRVLQGVAAGAALGTLSAAMIDTNGVRGTVSSAAAPGAGTGLGALVAGLVVAYLPWPMHLIYLLLLAAFAAQAVGVALLPLPATRRPGALASLRPHLAVPPEARSAFLTAAPVLFAVWALAGFYGSLGPALSDELASSTSVALGGVGLFILAGVASLTTVVLRAATGRTVMTAGIVTLVAGIAASVVAIRAGSVAGYFAATAGAGVGFGSGFQGGIRTVIPRAAAEQHTGLLSAIFLVSYPEWVCPLSSPASWSVAAIG